jgi:hypothetical protein
VPDFFSSANVLIEIAGIKKSSINGIISKTLLIDTTLAKNKPFVKNQPVIIKNTTITM